MAIRFNSELLTRDLETARRQRRLTIYRLSRRINVSESTLYGMRSGKIKDITVTTLARILSFLGKTDLQKYVYEDGEN